MTAMNTLAAVEKKKEIRTVKDLDRNALQGKRVLVRVDFNVPLSDSAIEDDTRIKASIPTIEYLRKNGAKVILISHLGRPKGKFQEEFSLRPIAGKLSSFLNTDVEMAKDCVGKETEDMVRRLNDGDVLLLENARFHKEETDNDPEFAKKLSRLADIFVQDAFGVVHRAHASTEGITHYLPSYSGLLLIEEIQALTKVLHHPVRPVVAIIGGAKISTKIDVLEHLLEKVDTMIIGGGMTYTLLKAQGHRIGNSLCENDALDVARSFLEKAKKRNAKIILPRDHVVVPEFKNEAPMETIAGNDLPDNKIGVDIGPETIKTIREVVGKAGTVIWNGPLGVFEMKNFAKGTFETAKALAESTAYTLVGGGDSVSAINQTGYADKIDHISTGGGASLEFLEGKELPGIKALKERQAG